MTTIEAPPTTPSLPAVLNETRRPPAIRGVFRLLRTLGIIGVVLTFIAPLVWMVLASVKTSLDITNPAKTFDFVPTMANYVNVIAAQKFFIYIGNSFLVAAGATAIALLFGVPAAYAIARFKVNNATAFILLARIIPGVSLLVPWYYLFSQANVVGTYGVLILTHIFVTMPLVVAIMSSFFDGVPTELEESAQVDGLTRIASFLRIVLPLSTPGIATATILAFIFSWNNFLFALVLSNQNTRTLPVAISNFVAYASVDWGGLMAASVLITVPVMLVALFAQKYIVSGLTAGATKG
jgi:multiple sugar transport system permease protein